MFCILQKIPVKYLLGEEKRQVGLEVQEMYICTFPETLNTEDWCFHHHQAMALQESSTRSNQV